LQAIQISLLQGTSLSAAAYTRNRCPLCCWTGTRQFSPVHRVIGLAKKACLHHNMFRHLKKMFQRCALSMTKIVVLINYLLKRFKAQAWFTLVLVVPFTYSILKSNSQRYLQ
jgi:hypothetical protein